MFNILMTGTNRLLGNKPLVSQTNVVNIGLERISLDGTNYGHYVCYQYTCRSVKGFRVDVRLATELSYDIWISVDNGSPQKVKSWRGTWWDTNSDFNINGDQASLNLYDDFLNIDLTKYADRSILFSEEGVNVKVYFWYLEEKMINEVGRYVVTGRYEPSNMADFDYQNWYVNWQNFSYSKIGYIEPIGFFISDSNKLITPSNHTTLDLTSDRRCWKLNSIYHYYDLNDSYTGVQRYVKPQGWIEIVSNLDDPVIPANTINFTMMYGLYRAIGEDPNDPDVSFNELSRKSGSLSNKLVSDKLQFTQYSGEESYGSVYLINVTGKYQYKARSQSGYHVIYIANTYYPSPDGK